MNDTHDLNRQPPIDPHPHDMPPAERAACANGFGAGERKAADELVRLHAELAEYKRNPHNGYVAEIIKLRAELAEAKASFEIERAHANSWADDARGYQAKIAQAERERDEALQGTAELERRLTDDYKGSLIQDLQVKLAEHEFVYKYNGADIDILNDKIAEAERKRDEARAQRNKLQEAYERAILEKEQLNVFIDDLAAAREALEEIARPIIFMQKRAKEAGNVLNGGMAIMLADDPDYLKKIARAFLERTALQGLRRTEEGT